MILYHLESDLSSACESQICQYLASFLQADVS